MKQLILPLVAIAWFLCSCEKERVSEDGLSGSISANIEGEAPFESVPSLTEVGGSANINGSLGGFYIVASDRLGRVLSLRLEGIYDGVGTYEIRGYTDQSKAVIVGILTSEGSWVAGQLTSDTDTTKMGEVVVTDVNKTTLNGTFFLTGVSADARDTKEITAGVFTINLVK